MLFQIVPQFLHTKPDPRLDRAEWFAEFFRHFALGKPLIERQLNRLPLVIWQCFHRCGHRGLQVTQFGGQFNRGATGPDVDQNLHRISRSCPLRAAIPLPNFIDAEVVSDAQQPGNVAASIGGETSCLAPGTDEDFLYQILA